MGIRVRSSTLSRYSVGYLCVQRWDEYEVLRIFTITRVVLLDYKATVASASVSALPNNSKCINVYTLVVYTGSVQAEMHYTVRVEVWWGCTSIVMAGPAL